MENDKFLKVKASLERLVYNDIFGTNSELLEHRMFFVCDEISKEMKSTWTINDTSMYEQQLLMSAIRNRMIFKLTETHQNSNFTFWLILRLAEFADVAYSPRFIKPNTIYYVITEKKTITGPHIIKEGTSVDHFNKAINQGRIYVPATRQLFEPFKIQESA